MMPISATGRNSQAGEAGFTLIELLVVLVVMGLLSAAVVIAIPDSRGSLVSEAQRFAARAKAARDKAIIDGRAVAVRVDASGYRFEQRTGREWRPMPEPYGRYDWTVGTAPLLAGAEGLLFDATGLSEPATLTLTRDGDRAVVTLDGAGAVRVGT